MRLSIFVGALLLMLASLAGVVQAQTCVLTDTYGTAQHNTPKPGARSLMAIAFGTSIMWGDGLLQEHTFRYLVADWVASQTGRPVQLATFAHSGALLSDPAGGGAGPVGQAAAIGDLNKSLPTVDQQVDCAAGMGIFSGASLILVEGCVNDVGAERVVYPWTETPALKTDTDEDCGPAMTTVLRKIRQRFASATIVVVGYYPLVSDRSSIFGFSGTRRLAKRATKVYTGRHAASRAAQHPQKPRHEEHNIMTVNSEAFYQHSKDALRRAVDEANPAGDVKVFFATLPEIPLRGGSPTVDPRFAYGAPLKHEWMIPARFLFFFAFYKDEKYWPRQRLCDAYVPDLLDRFVCQASSSFHPNPEGAKTYERSVEAVIPAATVSEWKAEQ